MKNIIALLAFFLLSACTHRQEPPITLPNTEIRLITSKENNVAYKLFVSLPEGYNTKGELVKNKKGMHDSMIVIFDGRE